MKSRLQTSYMLQSTQNQKNGSQKTVLWLICILYRQVFRSIFYFLEPAVHDQRSLSATAFGTLSGHFEMHTDSIFKVLLVL